MTSDKSRTQVQRARLGKEFAIKVGQHVAIKGEGLRLRFAGVGQDSRCPEDVNCVWAGNAEVLLEVTAANRCIENLKLNTHPGSNSGEEGKYAGYKVQLLKLTPSPRSDRKLAASDYTATLVVNKEK